MKSLPFCFILITTLLAACYPSPTDFDPIVPYFSNPVWAPEGQLIGCRKLADTAFTSPFTLTKSDGEMTGSAFPVQTYNAAWSPDGKWLAYTTGRNLFRVAFDGKSFDNYKR